VLNAKAGCWIGQGRPMAAFDEGLTAEGHVGRIIISLLAVLNAARYG